MSSHAAIAAGARCMDPEQRERQEQEWNSIPAPELDNVKWPRGCEVRVYHGRRK